MLSKTLTSAFTKAWGNRTTPALAGALLLFVHLALPSLAHAAKPVYDFNQTEAYLAPASAMDGWQATLTRYQLQRADLLACTAERGCRGRLKSFHRLMQRARDLSVEEKIQLTNYYINRNDYDDDRRQRRYDAAGRKDGFQRSQWMTLMDFLTRGGDCEDYASSKYFMLRELGLAADDMRVVVTYSRELRGYHAVLAVRLADDSVWLLDSDNRIRKSSHYGYRYIFALNEHSIWDHRKDYVGPG
ncbi:MAG: transglutaminase-like cysteine peptidase [Pseudomonadales bacterium]